MSTSRSVPLPPSLLLVMSNPDNREALRAMLTREGYRADAVGSAAEAISRVGQVPYPKPWNAG